MGTGVKCNIEFLLIILPVAEMEQNNFFWTSARLSYNFELIFNLLFYA